MPIINPHDPLSYPIGYDISGSATPLTFPEPRSSAELIYRLRQWLTVPRWRQHGWYIGAQNWETPECGCLLGGLAAARLGGRNPMNDPRWANGPHGHVSNLLEGDEITQEVIDALWNSLAEGAHSQSHLPVMIYGLFIWQDQPQRAYSEVLSLIDAAIAALGLEPPPEFWQPDEGFWQQFGNTAESVGGASPA